MQYNKKILSIRNDVENFQFKQNIDVNVLFVLLIVQHLNSNDILLDIGTGNGFVLSQILQNSDKRVKLFGIDNSGEMVKLARKNLVNNAEIIKANNNNLPFREGSFNVVTAKNVTRIDASEIFRVLKDDSIFIFREYGYNKGMAEITKMFKGRIIRQRKPKYYTKLLLDAGFQIVKFDQYEILRKYNSAKELVSIIKSFPFIRNFSKSDENIILDKFARNATITSDPFILVAKKLKGNKKNEKS